MLTNALTTRHYIRASRLIGALAACWLTAAVGVSPASAQTQPAPPAMDRIDLVGLTTRQPSPNSPTNQVQFQATVNYRLQSVPNGFVLLFLFENSANDSTQDSSNAIPIQRGTGQLVMNIDYTLRPEAKTLTLVAGVFKGEQKLIAWVSTNPIDMGPWPGRVYFEKAMAARLNNDFAEADAQLSLAIKESPDTGNFFYWRGDTRIRLQDYGDAIADFNRSIELMPKDRPSRVGRGIARLWVDDALGAIDDLSAVIESVPAPDRVSAWAFRARGLAHANLGQSSAAIADYTAYLDLSPTAGDRAQVEAWIAALS
jgi:tetratricopeptide (TPR) repeat protein